MYTVKLDTSDFQFKNSPFGGGYAYAQTKVASRSSALVATFTPRSYYNTDILSTFILRGQRAQIYLSELWAEKYSSCGINFYCMHPGKAFFLFFFFSSSTTSSLSLSHPAPPSVLFFLSFIFSLFFLSYVLMANYLQDGRRLPAFRSPCLGSGNGASEPLTELTAVRLTSLLRMKNRLRDAYQGADTIVWLAISPAVKDQTGLFYEVDTRSLFFFPLYSLHCIN